MSPRSFTEEERSRIDQSLQEAAARLMRKVRLRNITVEDLTREAGISKGSFYSFYRTRESLLWTVVKSEERTLVGRIDDLAQGDGELKERITRAFTEVLLDSKSLLFLLSPQDIASVTQKLPAEVLIEDQANGKSLLLGLLSSFGLARDQGTVNMLQSMVHTLGFVASNEQEGASNSAPELLELLAHTFAGHLLQRGTA